MVEWVRICRMVKRVIIRNIIKWFIIRLMVKWGLSEGLVNGCLSKQALRDEDMVFGSDIPQELMCMPCGGAEQAEETREETTLQETAEPFPVTAKQFDFWTGCRQCIHLSTARNREPRRGTASPGAVSRALASQRSRTPARYREPWLVNGQSTRGPGYLVSREPCRRTGS